MMKREGRLTLVLFLLAFAVSFTTLIDTDFFWHLASGRWILANMSIPTTDPFSFTFAGKPWVNIPWGYQVSAYVSERLGGFVGSNIFHSMLLAAALALGWLGFFRLHERSTKHEPPAPSTKKGKKDSPLAEEGRPLEIYLGVFVLLALFPIIATRWVPRPELFSQLLTALYVFILTEHHAQKFRLRRLLILPLLQIVWVNTHGMFVLGIILTFFGLVSDLFRKSDAGFGGRFKTPLLPILALVSLACLANPRGLTGALFPFHLLNVTQDPVYTFAIEEGNRVFSQGTAQIRWWIMVGLCLLSLPAGVRHFGWGYLPLAGFAVYFGQLMIRNITLSL